MIGLFDVNEKVVQVKNKDFLSQHSLFFSHGSFSGISIFPQIAFLLACQQMKMSETRNNGNREIIFSKKDFLLVYFKRDSYK